MVKQVDTKKEFDAIIEGSGDKLVVVDFTATWCGPCRFIGPKFEEMAETYKDVVFIKVDVDKNEETSGACGIECMPTFQFYKNGKRIDAETLKGADENGLRKAIEKLK